LEDLQHSARVCISALELMAAIEPNVEHERDDDDGIRVLMLELADALESGNAPGADTVAPLVAEPPSGSGSFAFLTRRLWAELTRMREVLSRMSDQHDFPYMKS